MDCGVGVNAGAAVDAGGAFVLRCCCTTASTSMAAIARSSSSKISMTGEEGAASPRPMTGGVGLGAAAPTLVLSRIAALFVFLVGIGGNGLGLLPPPGGAVPDVDGTGGGAYVFTSAPDPCVVAPTPTGGALTRT